MLQQLKDAGVSARNAAQILAVANGMSPDQTLAESLTSGLVSIMTLVAGVPGMKKSISPVSAIDIAELISLLETQDIESVEELRDCLVDPLDEPPVEANGDTWHTQTRHSNGRFGSRTEYAEMATVVEPDYEENPYPVESNDADAFIQSLENLRMTETVSDLLRRVAFMVDDVQPSYGVRPSKVLRTLADRLEIEATKQKE